MAPPAVWFAYSQDRKGEHPRQHLTNFTGILQADAYAGYVANAVMLRGASEDAAGGDVFSL